MLQHRLILRLIPTYVLVIGLCTAGVAWYAAVSVGRYYRLHAEREFGYRARLIESWVSRRLTHDHADLLTGLPLDPASRTRVTVLDTDATVLATRGDDLSRGSGGDLTVDLPDVQQALAGRTSQSTRYDPQLQTHVMSVARPLRQNGLLIGVLHVLAPLNNTGDTLTHTHQRTALVALAGVLLAVTVVVWVIHRRVHPPLEQLQRAAERFAQGHLDHTILTQDPDEIGSLAKSLNRMARQLQDRLSTITRHSQERQAILTSMIEGVVAVDAEERLISLNEAAAGLLNVDPTTSRGRRLFEVIRNPDLQQMVTRTLHSPEPVAGDVALSAGGQPRLLKAHGSLLRTSGSTQPAGALVVLLDITRLSHLEVVRQQFVANVSHELKTPIAAIKASVETILNERHEHTPPTHRFLDMIARQTDRLGAIVEDLLTLARIEQGREQHPIELTNNRVLPVVQAAIETCHAKAQDKHIDLVLESEHDAHTRINAPLLEQAVVNLLDNAIKYSPSHSRVRLMVQRKDSRILLQVQDQGPGIEPQHLSRVFERFYRVDKARSRSMGGTGLGLAIVKHIALAHHGRVNVTSTPGRGSCFSIDIPEA